MKGISFAGMLAVDKIKTIGSLPLRGELAKILDLNQSVGGCVCNTGIDFSRLSKGIPVKVYGVVGDDEDGDYIIKTLNDYNINTAGVKKRGTTCFTDVIQETSCHARTFYSYSGSMSTFSINDICLDDINTKIFHIGYLLLLDELDKEDKTYGTKMAQLLFEIQRRGIKTSIDVVSENSDRFNRIVSPSIKYVDYLIINEIEGGKTVNISPRNDDGLINIDNIKKILSKLFEMGVKKYAIIHCPEGAFGMSDSGEFLIEYSKNKPEGYIKGTVGAGDAFCAGSLLGIYDDKSLKDILVYGNAAAQVSLTSVSATDGVTSIEEAIKEYNRFK